ncbi:hypothetical protein C2E23DRAFT_883621 [Lenzites betulinus]|nr:hypothetical protein C2E23DRAFT_883621 [Lenzites betulinus]
MKFFSASLISVAFLVGAAQAQIQINAPTQPVTECVETEITWTGGSAPFSLSLLTSQHMRPPDICGSVIPTGETGDAAALQEFTNIATNSFFWIFNIYVADVTTVDLVVTDSTGASAQSAPITIQSGSDTSCLEN